MVPDSFFRVAITVGPEGPFYLGPYLNFMEVNQLVLDHLDLILTVGNLHEVVRPYEEIIILIEECIINSISQTIEVIDVRVTDRRASLRILD